MSQSFQTPDRPSHRLRDGFRLHLGVAFCAWLASPFQVWAQDTARSEDRTAGAAPAEASFTYTVGPDDVLTITVYDNLDLSGDFVVYADGGIVYPLLAHLDIAGLTAAMIEEKIRTLLEQDYLYDPIVKVTVKEHKSKKVEISGGVGKPGVYYLEQPLRLHDLLVQADGISNQTGTSSDRRRARITRSQSAPDAGPDQAPTEESVTIYVSLYDLLVEGRNEANILLFDGDRVYIPPARESMIHVQGEVKHPGSFPFYPGITAIKAIALAGGATRAAARKAGETVVFVSRDQAGEIVKVRLAMNDALQPDDILEVPLRFW